VLLCTLALHISCKEEQPPAPLTLPTRPFLTEAEFTQTPTLAARQNQVVVFDLEPTGAGRATAEDVSRYELETGGYRFCIEDGDPYLEHLSVETADGRRLVDLDASAGCRDVQLEAGTYGLRLRHVWSDVGGTHRLAFLHRIDARVGDAGTPRLGWWALAPDDPTGRGRAGRLHARPPPQHYGDGGIYASFEPIIADFSSQHIDDDGLFDFSKLGGGGLRDPQLPTIRGGPFPPSALDLTIFITDQSSSTFIASNVGLKWIFTPLHIVDVGNGKVQLQAYRDYFGGYYAMFIGDSDGGVYWDNKPPQLPFMNSRVLFRIFFPGDSNYAQAAPGVGEVALYQECNYGGPVTIFALDTPDLSALSSASVTLDRTTASVKLGGGAAAVLYPAVGYGGSSLTLGADTPCLDGTSIGRNTRSLQIQPVLPIFLATSSCVGCNLSGLDLTGITVSGADLSGANLSGTTLNRTSFHAAHSLVGTDFTSASVTCSDLSGTDGGVVDLTQTNLWTATFAPDVSSCRSNFSNTRVDDAHLPPAALGLLNLTNATIGLTDPLPGWDLRGAVWSGATVVGTVSLEGAHFDGALLEGTSLQGADLKGAIFHGATLTGANLTGAQLDGSQMQDAGFQGATLIDATGLNTAVVARTDFSGARFGGSDLVGALLEDSTFDGATFASGTDLTAVQFNRSSLQNVDLSDLTLHGAGFVRANLRNSSLAGARLSNNPDGGSPRNPADFTGAHLKDVNLSNAQLQGTIFHFASFYGSFNVLKGPPVLPCQTDTAKHCPSSKTGFTCSCASATGAKMIGTDFTNAFLYGVDFTLSGTVIDGVDFSNAILVGADFDGAMFEVDQLHGGSKFAGAFLQGANFGTASVDDTSFPNAYLDFEPGGNQMQVLLGPSYTGFTGWSSPNQPVCVKLNYTAYVTHVPVTTSNTTCPDGLVHAGGCGRTPPRPTPNPNWASPVAIGQASSPGYYVNDATYTQADQSQSCNQGSTNFEW
jgi:uncharacterized protein YjbI with pentapeptide repeats